MPSIGEPVKKGPHTLVVSDRAERRDRRIAPTVILNQFSAICAEASEVWIRRIQDWSGLLVAERNVRIEVQRPVIPLRVLENRLTVI